MTYNQLIKHFTSAAEAARQLGFPHRQRVQRWKDTGIPVAMQAYIQNATGGDLKAEKHKRAR